MEGKGEIGHGSWATRLRRVRSWVMMRSRRDRESDEIGHG